MTASSVFMGLIGIALILMPNEIIEALGQETNEISTIAFQLTGALYFGFAMTNWMAKGAVIGGIYSRPLAIGNFSHFMIAGLALVKTSLSSNPSSAYTIALTIIYVVFAISFGYIAFTHPKKSLANQ